MSDKPDMMAALKTQFPELDAPAIKSLFLAQAFGPMPPWSSLSGPKVQNVKTATVGSSVICYANDPSVKSHVSKTGAPVIALIKRSDKGAGGEDRYGVLGGYMNLGADKTAGEQPKQGAVRELTEETVDDEGKPVISPAPERLRLVASGVDYRKAELPVAWNAHALELSASELGLLKQHAKRMGEDGAYAKAVKQKSGNEVDGLLIMPLTEALAMGRECFTHPHEFDAIKTLAEQLKQQSISEKQL